MDGFAIFGHGSDEAVLPRRRFPATGFGSGVVGCDFRTAMRCANVGDLVLCVLSGAVDDLAGAGDDETDAGRCFSAGVATWPADGDELVTLLKCADERLYEAKGAGRARVV